MTSMPLSWHLSEWVLPLGVMLLGGVGIFLFFFWIGGGFNGTNKRWHELCDREVEALLHSTDLVEVTRAGILVRYMDCGVSKRL